MHLVTSILHGNHVDDNGTTVVLLQNTTSYSTFGQYHIVELFCGVHVFYVVLTPHTPLYLLPCSPLCLQRRCLLYNYLSGSSPSSTHHVLGMKVRSELFLIDVDNYINLVLSWHLVNILIETDRPVSNCSKIFQSLVIDLKQSICSECNSSNYKEPWRPSNDEL